MKYSELEHVEGESSGKKLSEEAREDCMQNSKRGGWTTFPYIIGTELGLSLAATGWGCNLTVYLITVFSLKSIHATQISSIVAGSSNLFPIAGTILADSFFGSFSVISIFSIISLSEKYFFLRSYDKILTPLIMEYVKDDLRYTKIGGVYEKKQVEGWKLIATKVEAIRVGEIMNRGSYRKGED
ncbi:protein NRT1/ PTR FAMILY 2.5-like isoform X2 [Apium graveolens]|uniref:protein NRT1/ PTR FAMILY 2.5-like isoform X2 n=1 Tax=Apium graveolens TaxID=4045 RepID=UPI003D795A8C